jgi:hypothetical protein
LASDGDVGDLKTQLSSYARWRSRRGFRSPPLARQR